MGRVLPGAQLRVIPDVVDQVRCCSGGMSDARTRLLDSAFGQPRGLLGRLGAALMARGNHAAELQVVRLARLSDSDTVLVVGPGPGIGLRAAGEQAALAIGVEPSQRMRQVAEQRCADLVHAGKVELRAGTAEATGMPESSCDVALSVNNAQLWPDRARALAELYRVLRPGGGLLISTHQRWLTGGREGLSTDVGAAGFDDVQSWVWQPPGRRGIAPVQLRARRPT
jgi:arsenite methyltransferase